MSDVQSIASIQQAIATGNASRTTLVDSKAPWEILLAQELALAKKYFVNNPEGQIAQAGKSQKSEGTELTQSFRSVQLAEQKNESNNNGIPALPVEDFATSKGFLRMADIQFDKNNQKWSATWEKPQLFNFGMLLRPAIAQTMSPGESYSFVSRGKPTTITCTNDKELLLQRGNEKIALNASELRNLLSDQISVNGINVFLDRRGNLVMEARGPKALSMPTVSKM